jgi:cyclopropane-fatty-acyl-phospholipid synthase
MEVSTRPGASPEAIQFHYDLGNEFYRLWLDSSLTYSCGLWDGAETLEEAQRAKIKFHIDKAEARGKERVLDIGCGWGANLKALVNEANVASAVGLTLAEEQANHISKSRMAGVQVHIEHWSDHQPELPYDAIISVGAFEHFAAHGISVDEKLAGYRRFFEKCASWLKPGGKLSLQTMCYGNSFRKDFSPFFAEQIFPESDLPRLSEIIASSDPVFEVVSARNDRRDYARTSLEWRKRLRLQKEKAIKLVGEESYDRYDKYLHLWAIGFHTGTMGLMRIEFKKST